MDNTDDQANDVDDVNKQPMTLWTLAYRWAGTIISLGSLNAGLGTVSDPGDSLGRVLLARTISTYARGIDVPTTVSRPGALDYLSVAAVGHYLDKTLTVVADAVNPDLGAHPRPGEEGFDAYTEMLNVLDVQGASTEDFHAVPQVQQHVTRTSTRLINEVTHLGRVVFRAAMTAVPDVAPAPHDLLFGDLRRHPS